MAIQKGVNSLATVEEAEAYFAGRLSVVPWKSAKLPLKETSLVTGTMLFNDMRWSGLAISASQTLAFPRVGSYFEPIHGRLVEFESNGAPARVLRGLFELALHLLTNPDVLSHESTIEDLSVGPIDLKGIKPASTIPNSVISIIEPVLKSRGASLWWRAN